MQVRALKYGVVFTTLLFGVVSFMATNWTAYALLLYAFGLVPLLELLLRPNAHNLSKTEMEVARNDRIYDYLLYAVVPVLYGFLIWFLFTIDDPTVSGWVTLGKVSAMGIACGVLGINVAHELGHRHKKSEQFLAKVLLLSSLYMHFFIEHNRGHHARVSTKEDPASARRGEILYSFWVRSVIGSYLSAWKIENSRLRRKNLPVFSLKNEMLVYQLVQVAFLSLIGVAFGGKTLLYFLGAATIGFLLLETVNYIEHYGLERQKMDNGRYERVRPDHSWNSDHPLGRLLLFELSRHSDHHHRAGRKYQMLRHVEGTPQMPTGYPGMMVMSTIPPLWFWVMHREINAFHTTQQEEMPEGVQVA
ncbi:MAG: alkane 1-monooxygenase [Bacteroidota bacterium]